MHKILLVDDMRSFLDLETTFLQRADVRVLTASTGLEAIRVAKADQPDLIVLDIEMPEMNGIQACRILKADPRTQRIPVIVLTSMQIEDEARRAGADRFARKPIDEPTFLAEIKKLLPIIERSEPRAGLDVPVTLAREGRTETGRVQNLSRSGFYVATNATHPVGARLDVSFQLPEDLSGHLISAEVLVVRLGGEPAEGFGCRFFRLSSGARLFVDEYLAKAAARGD